jgi:hypothetical protein
MTLPVAPQRDAATPILPRAAIALIAQLRGWTHTITPATGPYSFGGLSEDTDGEGKRHRIEVTQDVDSVCLRAQHATDGRRLVAVWIKRKSWSLDTAFRWSWPWEHGIPLKVTATELTAYVVEPVPVDPRVRAREAEQLAADLAELAQHRARWAANQDVWVPIPMRWDVVTPGSVMVGSDGSPWSVGTVTPGPGGVSVRARFGEQEYFGRPTFPTAQVLVPVPVRDALTLLRSELGSRIVAPESERKTA